MWQVLFMAHFSVVLQVLPVICFSVCPLCILQVKITWEVSSYICIISARIKDDNCNSCYVHLKSLR